MSAVKKADLAAKVANKLQITEKEAAEAIGAVLEAISGQLVNGNEVSLAGFGIFRVRQSAARTGRNPKTGEPIPIAAKNQPSFKASKTLKDALNK